MSHLNTHIFKNNRYFTQLAVLLLPIFLFSPLHAKNFTYQFVPDPLLNEDFMKIKNISSLGIANNKVNGIPIKELSGLTWDDKAQILYAISDAGFLYHIKLTIEKGEIRNTNVIHAYALTNKNGKKLNGQYQDSEGLSLVRDNKGNATELIISFEHKPRIARYRLNGQWLGEISLPNVLTKKSNYQSKNKALEGVTLHPQFGIITAAERPLKHAPKKYQTLYSQHGTFWHFKQSPFKNSSVTGLETLPNGDILVLERVYNGLFSQMVISIRQVKLSSCNAQQQCEVEDLAVFNSLNGWRIDNFEGLSHYKGNQYLIISDDNNSPLQNSVLVKFEIK